MKRFNIWIEHMVTTPGKLLLLWQPFNVMALQTQSTIDQKMVLNYNSLVQPH